MKKYKALILAFGAVLVFSACGDDSGSEPFTCDVSKTSDSVTMKASFGGESITEVAYISDDKVYYESDLVFSSTAEADDVCSDAKEEGFKDIKCSGKNVSYTIVSNDAEDVTIKDLYRDFENMCVEYRESYDEEDDDDDDDDEDEDDDDGYRGDDE